MDMIVIYGVLFHLVGGFASGSFYMPFSQVKGWHWESYWIIGGLFSWLIVPPLAAWITIPGFTDIIARTDTGTLCWTYFMGVLWGIGGLTYGLGVRYLGMSWAIQSYSVFVLPLAPWCLPYIMTC
jgi:L-rhamnose-proton symport protein (RhaT).